MSSRRTGDGRAGLAGAALVAVVLTAGCTSPPTAPSDPGPTVGATTASPTTAAPSADSSATPTPSEIPEPTTTNTLPPPPAPTKAAPSTAGDLSARSLPVPPGWRTIARDGGGDEGYLGNGTWVHQRDPRYAAFDAITIGCAAVTRDDYRDPTAALEGTYDRGGAPGIGLVLQFATADQASAYFDLYLRQVAACTGADAPVRITREQSSSGLIDRRTYDDGEWTEIARAVDRRVTLIILSDAGHRMTRAQAEQVLGRIR